MLTTPVWQHGGRCGPHRRYRDTHFFACEGLIAVHDEREKSQMTGDIYNVVTPDEFEDRANQLYRMARKATYADKPWIVQEAHEMKKGCREMKEAVKEAREMGDPNDPEVQAFWAKHRRNNRISLNYEHGAPDKSLDEMNRAAPQTGRTAQPTLDQSQLDTLREKAMVIRKNPVRKNAKNRIIIDL